MASILDSLRQRQERVQRLHRERGFDHPALSLAGNWAKVSGGKALLATKGNGPARIDESARSATLTISTVSKDRHGDYVLPAGCMPYLDSFKRNPVVYLNHRHHDHPIGKASSGVGNLALEVEADRIVSTCFFHGATLESDQVFELMRLDVYRAASIGFRPIRGKRIKPPEPDESAPRDQVDFGSYWYSFEFQLWELLEWSIVGIPANPDAVGLALGKGLCGKPICDTLRRNLEPYAPIRRSWDLGLTSNLEGAMTRSWEQIKSLAKASEEEDPEENKEEDEEDTENKEGENEEKEGDEQEEDKEENPEEDGEENKEEEDEEGDTEEKTRQAVQALLVPKSAFAESDEAAQHVESMNAGLDTSDVEDAGEFWAFIQFEASLCSTDSAAKQELEDGCIAVVCTRAEEEEEKTSRVAPVKENPAGSGQANNNQGKSHQGKSKSPGKSKGKSKGTGTGKTCGCPKTTPAPQGKSKGKSKSKTPVKTGTKKDLAGSDSGSQDSPGQGDQGKKVLPGVAMIRALKVLLEEHSPLQENAAVLKACEKTTALWQEVSGKAYPEEDFGWPKSDSEEGEGAEGEGEEGEGEEEHEEPDKDEEPGEGESDGDGDEPEASGKSARGKGKSKSQGDDFAQVLAELARARKSAEATEAALHRLTGK